MSLTGSRIAGNFQFAYSNFTATPIYNQCALYLPASGPFGQMAIRMRLTKLGAQTVNGTVTQLSSGPILDLGTNTAAGGNSIAYGVNQLPRIQFEGTIDTPMNSTTHMPALSITQNSTPIFLSYPEIIAMYFEGRINVASNGLWRTVNPLWWRDPYGKCYPNPRTLAFQAQRLQGVPGRHTFQMTLLVGMSS